MFVMEILSGMYQYRISFVAALAIVTVVAIASQIDSVPLQPWKEITMQVAKIGATTTHNIAQQATVDVEEQSGTGNDDQVAQIEADSVVPKAGHIGADTKSTTNSRSGPSSVQYASTSSNTFSLNRCKLFVYDVIPDWDNHGTWNPKYGGSAKPVRDVAELYNSSWIPEYPGFLDVSVVHDVNAELVLVNLIHKRLLNDPRRVLNPKEATVFFVPLMTGESSKTNYTEIAVALQKENPHFDLSSSPKKHFWVHPFPTRTTLSQSGRTNGWPGSPQLFNGWQGDVTRLALETFYHSAQVHRVFVPIPYLSAFAGTPRLNLAQIPSTWRREQPSILAYGEFGTHGTAGGRIREKLAQACELNHDCKLSRLSASASWWKGKPASYGTHKYDLLTSINAHRRAIFSLQPPGDTFTRKGVFDAMALGCIPVFFDPRSFYYPWFGASSVDEFSILISPDQVQSTMKILRSIPQEQIRKMQLKLVENGMMFNYAHELSNCNPQDGCIDAYEVIVQNMCERGGE